MDEVLLAWPRIGQVIFPESPPAWRAFCLAIRSWMYLSGPGACAEPAPDAASSATCACGHFGLLYYTASRQVDLIQWLP
ncbi:MAG: hypothetical protein KDI75_10170 [Xanthomonadales bacterium]|nr:hypothetical protein [Xanthomonadales bacterium]